MHQTRANEPTRSEGGTPSALTHDRDQWKIIVIALVVVTVVWTIALRNSAETKRDTSMESREPGMEQMLPR